MSSGSRVRGGSTWDVHLTHLTKPMHLTPQQEALKIWACHEYVMDRRVKIDQEVLLMILKALENSAGPEKPTTPTCGNT